MNSLRFAPVFLIACSVTGAPPKKAEKAAPVEQAAAELETLDEVMVPMKDRDAPIPLADTVKRVESILAEVKALDPAKRAEAAQAIAVLDVNCPYTRLSHQLALALHHQVMKRNERVEGWSELQRGLTAHVALLDELGVDLHLPAFGDHLNARWPGVAIDRESLLTSHDPVLASVTLQKQIEPLSMEMSQATLDKIWLQNDRAERAMGHYPTFADVLRGWTSALQQMEPSIRDPHLKSEVSDMLYVLETYSNQGC